jgi:hypothetical protein
MQNYSNFALVKGKKHLSKRRKSVWVQSIEELQSVSCEGYWSHAAHRKQSLDVVRIQGPVIE